MIIRKGQAPVVHADEEDTQYYGSSELLPLADVGGLTQFGAHLQTLQPGTRSSDRHWHEAQDEFLYVISGEATVIEEDGPHLLQPGDAACWPAGAENAHQVVNRSESPCSFLIFGTLVLLPISSITLTRERSSTTSRTARRGGSATTGP